MPLLASSLLKHASMDILKADAKVDSVFLSTNPFTSLWHWSVPGLLITLKSHFVIACFKKAFDLNSKTIRASKLPQSTLAYLICPLHSDLILQGV